LIYYYQYYFQYYLPEDVSLFDWFSLKEKNNNKRDLRVNGMSGHQKLWIRINEFVADNAFFNWLRQHNPLFRNYEKNIVNDPHVDVVVKDEKYQDYEVYRQVNKKKYSKMV